MKRKIGLTSKKPSKTGARATAKKPAKSSGRTKPSVTVLPETDENTLCVEMKGLIRRQDYEKNFRNRILAITSKKRRFNVLIFYAPSFKGWEPEAADLSLKSIMELGKKINRQACINTPNMVVFRNKLSSALFGGQTRYFDKDNYDEALAWVKGGRGKKTG
ncbi:MAG TPA: STAS/SEC14 domain-containing protein [Patescibacteria group bacterium]|nr:STAS/SEC14 domain-containing protein [Patescibacteria group bacterium]